MTGPTNDPVGRAAGAGEPTTGPGDLGSPGGPQDRIAPHRGGEMPVIGGPGSTGPLAPAGTPGGQVARSPERAVGPTPSSSASTTAGRTEYVVFGDHRREGIWEVPDAARFVSVFGDVRLDLREARFSGTDEVTIACDGAFGDVRLTVPPGAEVEVRGAVIFGDRRVDLRPGTPPAGFPRIVVQARRAFGDVRVRTLEPGEAEPRRWLHR